MADVIQFPNQEEKSIPQLFVEGYGLEFPKDVDMFFEIFLGFEDGGTIGELFDALIEAFPDKKESILNVPIYAEADGKLVRARLPEKVKNPSEQRY